MRTTTINPDAIRNLLEKDHPQTERQVFYRAVSRGLIQKLEEEYEALVRLLHEMRSNGAIPTDWITEPSR